MRVLATRARRPARFQTRLSRYPLLGLIGHKTTRQKRYKGKREIKKDTDTVLSPHIIIFDDFIERTARFSFITAAAAAALVIKIFSSRVEFSMWPAGPAGSADWEMER